MFNLVSPIKSVAAYLVVLLLSLFALPAFAGTASLAWNASASTTVTGYKVHYGTASGAYSKHLDAGKVLSLTVPSLTAGTKYYFAVTAYNSAGESGYSNEASATIPVGTTAPVASFTSTPTNLTAAFTSTSTGTNPLTYAWNFGDSATSTAQNPTHTYSAAGTYTVTLTATNSAGSNTKTGSVTVTAGTTAPTADFSATVRSGTAPLPVTFTPVVSSGLTSFRWKFGDGSPDGSSTSAVPKISHTYTASGNFNVEMTATGTAGSKTVTKATYIQTGNVLQAAFAANRTSGIAPMRVSFDDQSSGTINSYSWNFGDGTTPSRDPNPVHTYRKPGNYTATLTVSGPAGTSLSKNVTIAVKAADELVVDYWDGIYTYVNNAAWPTKIINVSGKQMVTVDIDQNGKTRLLVDHGTGRSRTGLWLYQTDGTAAGTTGTQIDPLSAVSLTVGDIDGDGKDDVIADFGSGKGIWRFADLPANNKSQIDTRTAKQIVLWDENDVHDDMPELFASFPGTGADSGIQMYSFANGRWYSYDPHVPVWMATADINHNGYDDLVIDFGPGPGTPESTPQHGIWTLFDGAASWKQLDVNSGLRGIKADFDSSNYDDLVVDFGTGTGQKVRTGLWGLYNGSSWGQIHSNTTTKRLVAADLNADGKQNIVADFGANKGIWQFQQGATWVRIDTTNGENTMAAGQFK